MPPSLGLDLGLSPDDGDVASGGAPPPDPSTPDFLNKDTSSNFMQKNTSSNFLQKGV